ncbi:MAG: transcriptional repressor NrdR [Deltaproteobacteria bacterium]|nr:transcriptional repressor NrdR [Deltaproteobacteria bacterium]
MKCPYCPNLDSKVIDSRISRDGSLIRRRRECEECGRRFTTYERVEEPLPAVVKKDGRREPYDRLKLAGGVRKACEKRPVSTANIEALIDRVERWVLEQGEPEIKSADIGVHVMQELKAIDEIAYVRFASVYRSFRDVNEFVDELKQILGKPKP